MSGTDSFRHQVLHVLHRRAHEDLVAKGTTGQRIDESERKGYYAAAQKVIACPCHASQFNASTGAVEAGPAPRGLKKLTVAEGSSGQLYVS